MLKTSYFYKSGTLPNAVAISAKVPDFYKGRCYKKLAPTWDIFKEWKETGDEKLYTKRYCEEVLSKLNPIEVYNELGEDSILLCFENSEKFCHRHIVANWLNNALHIDITEL